MTADEIARGALERGAVQKENELAALIDLLLGRPPRLALEIGVYQGGTLWAWGQLAGEVWGIDKDPKPELEPIPGCGLLKLDSHDAATLVSLQMILRTPVDFLFIDGDHTYDGVAEDFRRFAPLVRPGGLVAFHDICHHQDPDMGVERFWQETRGQYLHQEFIGEPTWWGGIGVLMR